MLANGEFVIPADVVSALGNGSNDAGADKLTGALHSIRKQKQKNGTGLPPDSKDLTHYIVKAKHKVKA